MKTQDTRSRPAAACISLQRILVPVDFSALSKKAMRYAVKLSQVFNAEISLFHVIEPDLPPFFDGATMAPPIISNGTTARRTNRMKRWISSARSAGATRIASIIQIGLPAHQIVETARNMDVDLIVIGTHGYTGWKHLAIGSTAERVVRAAPCPVLVVREKEHEFI
jgi:nucleotide-binding universal stress UspA family protein